MDQEGPRKEFFSLSLLMNEFNFDVCLRCINREAVIFTRLFSRDSLLYPTISMDTETLTLNVRASFKSVCTVVCSVQYVYK